MTLTYILFVLGFVILVKGAGWLVDGASSIAKNLGISSLAVGLTVVAFGTSAPELVVNLLASLSGHTDIAIGNILGSNIANTLLILGIAAIIYPLRVSKGTVWKEIPLSLLATLILGIVASDAIIDGRNFSEVSRIDGLMLIAFLLIFFYYIVSISKSKKEVAEKVIRLPLGKSLLMVGGGLVFLTLGGKWVVDGATALALILGVSQAMIGLTIVAVGTSLPELATTVVAAYKKHADIAIGNIVGSNIFNIFWILGISAIINPLSFSPVFLFDVWVAIGATLLLFIFMFIGQKHTLDRSQGAGFVALYILYIAVLIYK